jgi:hypothetical protein
MLADNLTTSLVISLFVVVLIVIAIAGTRK